MKEDKVKYETEAKIRVERFDEVIDRLHQADEAVYKDDVTEVDTYYKDPDGRLIAAGSGLRLRRRSGSQGPQALLTWKGPVRQGPYKSRPEAQTQVADDEEMDRILTSLGYRPAIVVDKRRQLWQFGDCEVCLDEVTHLGRFVEVEGPGDEAIEQVLVRLDLASRPHIHSGYARMLSEVLDKTADKQE